MADFSFYFGLGWHHIISPEALDHILFIVALSAIYTMGDWRQVLILVTAFTIGHSITLALSVLDIIRLPGNWVEFLIPCTIVFTATSNIFRRSAENRSVRVNYYLALFFGLVHGMGFANALRFMLATDQPLAPALFAFNVGLEAGQLVLVGALLLIAYVLVKKMHINRREWVLFVSASVFGLALQMALERLPK